MSEYPDVNPIEVRYLDTAVYPPKEPAHSGDIGLDIRADIEVPIALLPGQGTFISGGFQMEFGRGWAGLILPRSSSNRRGLHVCIGVIDNGYTGVIGAEIRNIHPSDTLAIRPGDRIAQLVIIAAFRPVPKPVHKLRETDRGEQGWGSTGS